MSATPPFESQAEPADGEPEDVSEPIEQEVEQRTATVEARVRGERLDRWLAMLVREFSRSHLQGLIEAGQVSIDGSAVRSSSRRVHAGQVVQVNLVPPPQSAAFLPEAMALDCVFEDEHLIVINKPVGLVVHPAPGHWSGTLLNGLLAHHAPAATLPRAGIVHRLDKDTSGLMVVGKTLEAVTALSRAIAARDVSRLYLALVHGVPQTASFHIDAPIGRDPISRVRMAVVAGGRAARTDVTVLASTARHSAVRCRLHTGRTHQIRVHLAHRGHPLVADSLYGGRAELGMQRQALHAHALGFEHPVHGRMMQFESAPPEDLRAAWQCVVDGDGPESARIKIG